MGRKDRTFCDKFRQLSVPLLRFFDMNLRVIFSVLLLSSTFSVLCGQIYLDNASFEGQAQDATVPVGWHPCDELTTPDMLPGFWGVLTEPEDGDTYMGLITREDGTNEQVGQRLSTPLQGNECYTISMYLAHSSAYAGFNLPVKLRIWGATSRCSKKKLLVDTGAIKHEDWKKYEFKFYCPSAYNYLIFEAEIMDGVYFPYNGNILIDGISVIMVCQRV